MVDSLTTNKTCSVDHFTLLVCTFFQAFNEICNLRWSFNAETPVLFLRQIRLVSNSI